MSDTPRVPFPPPSTTPVAVLGDLIWDRYVSGRVERISPEAPVPVLRVTGEEGRLGGAANVAANIAALGARVRLYGVVGADDDGRALRTAARRAGVDPSGICVDRERPTIRKERFVTTGHQQLLRADREPDAPVPARTAAALRRAVSRDRSPGAWIVSDYHKGTLDAAGVESLVRRARERGIPVVVDPKRTDWSAFRGATVICPNRAEAEAASGIGTATLDGARRAARNLASRTRSAVLVTLGPEGMWLQDGRRGGHIRSQEREVFDPTGAGDTVAAALAVALASGATLEDAARLANLAAGLSVEHFGTVAVTRAQVLSALDGADPMARKFVPRRDLIARVTALRRAGRRLAFANGCFDLLHAGHVRLLQKARREADALIVAMNSDRSVRALKGRGRPVLDEHDRAQLLCALDATDLVTVFDENSVLPLLRQIRPEVLVKGEEYSDGKVVGEAFVRAYGGRVVLVPMLKGRSTTLLLRKASTAPARKLPPGRTGGYVR